MTEEIQASAAAEELAPSRPMANEKSPYSPLFRVPRVLLSPFYRPYRLSFAMPKVPTVFLCRHLNMHGPFRTLTAKGMRARPCVLSVFHSYRGCVKQYADYTFSARAGMPRPLASVLAAGAALGVVPIVHALRSIAVYRGQSMQSAKTVKDSVAALLAGDHIIVYPDKDYTASDKESRSLYEGFLLFERHYFRKTGFHLPFVVLTLDDEKRLVNASAPIAFREDESYADASARVTHEILAEMFPEDLTSEEAE